MFKIIQNPTYSWPVTVEFPADGGRVEKATFDIELRRLTQSRLNEIRDAIENGTTSDVELAREVVVGWSGITDENGEVPYSDAARDRLLDIPLVAGAIVMAMFTSIAGAKRKN